MGWRIKVNLVAFLLIAFGLVYAMATQVLSILQGRISVDAIFQDAGGVFTNQEVTYRGVTVGQVGDMEVVPDGVRIELLIDDQYKIPKEGIEARVMFKSAVGEQFVDLLPANNEAPYLASGDEIPKEQTSIPVSTQALLSTLEAVLRGVPPEDLKGTVDALGIGLTGRGPDLATIIESSADLAQLFSDRAPEVEGILKKGTKVGAAFLNSKEDFKQAIEQLVAVSDSLSDSRGSIDRLMRGTNLTSDQLLKLIRDNRGNVNRFLTQFAEVNAIQAAHADDLNDLFLYLPSGLGNIVKAFEPSTGLIRFGLVNDNNNPACSYGTQRRAAADRSPRKPPLNAHCAKKQQQQQQQNASATSTSGSASSGTIPGAGSLGTVQGPVLPQRMSEWSWTLFYLNSV
jgi:phospholipid/cholesterol/gamma-HCH transport system substrate-binding protein